MKPAVLFSLIALFISTNVQAAELCSEVFSTPAIISPVFLDNNWLAQMHNELSSDNKSRKKLREAVQANGLLKVSLNYELIKSHNSHYTKELPQSTASDQQDTGTCWINAMCNEVRNRLVAQGKVDSDFNFSRAYFQFYDQLEKTDKWLYETAETLKPGLKAKDLAQVLDPSDAIQDGGQHVDATFLIWKYGMVPNQVMPDTISSLHNGTMLTDLKTHLAQSAELMHETYLKMKFAQGQTQLTTEQITELQNIRKKSMMGVYRILTTHLGLPPHLDQEFSYRISDGSTKKFTPQSFAKNFSGFDPNEYVVIATSPVMRPNRGLRFSDQEEGELPEGSPDFSLRFLSVTKKRMESLVKAAIDSGRTAWFASDADEDIDVNSGIMHPKIYEKNQVYGMKKKESLPSVSSEKRGLYYGLTGPDHAMAIVGYDQPDPQGAVVKYKVENSWGQGAGDNGFFHMYDEWFDKYVFMVVVPRSIMTEEELKHYDNPHSATWDQFL